jgi:hypothetical protein
VIEEVLMRLVIFRLIWRVAGVWPALLLTALLFGGLHLSNPDASAFAALCLMLAWRRGRYVADNAQAPAP